MPDKNKEAKSLTEFRKAWMSLNRDELVDIRDSLRRNDLRNPESDKSYVKKRISIIDEILRKKRLNAG